MSEQTTNQVEHSQDGVRHTLRIVVPAADMSERVDAATQAYRSRAKLAGFRPGKAPLSMVRQQFGADIRKHVLDHMLPEVLSSELETLELRPLDSPELADVQFEPGNDLEFTVNFDTAPEVEVTNLDLSATRPAIEVTDEMVVEALEQLRERGGQLVAVEDAPAAMEMFGRCEMELLPKDGKGKKLAEEDRFVRIGHEQAIPALNEELVGMREGESTEFTTTLGEQYPNAILAGKEVLCRVTLAELKQRTLPEVDDEFAKDLGAEDLAELRGKVAADIQANLENNADRDVQTQLLKGLRDGNPVDVPDSLIERRLDEMSRRFANDLAQQGIDPRNALDWQAFRKEQRTAAADSIAEEMLLDHYAVDQEIEVDDDTVEEEIRTQMEQSEGGNGRSVASFTQQMRKDGSFDGLRVTMRRRLALERLQGHATIDIDSGETPNVSGPEGE
ncbi:MAG: trigger factor [Acidobacteria bacterium]|nr:trigger factor [Acidobacteriota bacterium]